MARPESFPFVRQFINNRGNPMANHFLIDIGDVTYLQSYRSIVVRRELGKITLGINWDYSNTTMKAVGKFLGHNTAETRKKIKSGEIIFDPEMV